MRSKYSAPEIMLINEWNSNFERSSFMAISVKECGMLSFSTRELCVLETFKVIKWIQINLIKYLSTHIMRQNEVDLKNN